MISLISRIKTHWVFLSVFGTVVITVLSLYPLDNLPAVPGGDKTHHLVAYAALMFPAALRKPKGWILVFVFFVFWSGGIELLQPYVNRYGEWLDMAANVAGLGFGLLLARLVSWIIPLRFHAN